MKDSDKRKERNVGTRDSLFNSLAALADLNAHEALGYALEQALQTLQASSAAAWAYRNGEFTLLLSFPPAAYTDNPAEPGIYADGPGTRAIFTGLQDQVRWALTWDAAPEETIRLVDDARRANPLMAQAVERYAMAQRTTIDSAYSEYDTPDILIEYILRAVSELVPCNMLAIYNYRPELDTVRCDALVSDRVTTPELKEAIEAVLRQKVLNQHLPLAITQAPIPGFDSGLFIPLVLPDQVIGAMVLLASQPNQLVLQHVNEIRSLVSLARMVLENLRLYDALTEELVAAQSVLMTAKMITIQPSPQNIVNNLRDYLFDEHVTVCALITYGPTGDEDAAAPPEFVHVAGTWSQANGSGFLNGFQMQYDQVPEEVLALLQQQDYLEEYSREKLDRWLAHMGHSTTQLVSLASLQAFIAIPLRRAGRELGMLFVGSDRMHPFTQPEIRSYRMVSEFLAINMVSQDLQHQNAVVQTGRAALMESINDGIVMLTPKFGEPVWHVLTVNQLFCRMFGLTEALHGVSLDELMDRMVLPDTLREPLRNTWTVFSRDDNRQYEGEFRMIHPDGYPVDVHWFSAPVYQDIYNMDGKDVLGRILSFHDVTAERTAVRVRSDFLGRVSHELRTPLTSIRGFAEFILEAVGEELPDLAREYLNIILKSASHLNTVFTDMLEITRADAGELKLKMTDAHLPDVIIDVVARLEFQFKAREQDPVMDLNDDLPSVHIDTDRITQVLTNLVANAIKYAPEKSQIRIITRLIETRAGLPTSAPSDTWTPCILITVNDHGKGLTEEEARRVFEPFYRSKAARESKTEGAGLGLAVSRSIIELHRGAIWAEARSKSHKGGRFHFTLPVNRP